MTNIERDAARYRWLRSRRREPYPHFDTVRHVRVEVCDWGRNLGGTPSHQGVWCSMALFGRNMDSEIDRQMKKRKQRKET